MPFSPTGVYSLPPGYLAVDGQYILSSQHNPPLEDIGKALSLALLRDGRSPLEGIINMNNFRIANLGSGETAADAVNLEQLEGVVTFPNSNCIQFPLGNKLIQCGLTAVNTNAFGNGSVTYGITFSAAPKTVIAMNGNANVSTSSVVLAPVVSGATFSFSTSPIHASQPIQVNWLAIGDRT